MFHTNSIKALLTWDYAKASTEHFNDFMIKNGCGINQKCDTGK